MAHPPLTSPEPWETAENAIPPPYWQVEASSTRARRAPRRLSSGPQISLVDNTGDETARSAACWARSVRIREYHVIGGGLSVLGSYVVFACCVQTENGSFMTLQKRYSEFDRLRENLLRTFPNSRAALPKLPPKSALHKFQTKFLDKRKEGLEYFLNCIICNPEFSASPILKDFLFS